MAISSSDRPHRAPAPLRRLLAPAAVLLAASVAACGGGSPTTTAGGTSPTTSAAPATSTSTSPVIPGSNGVDQLTPAEAVKKANAAFIAASTVSMKGSVPDSGKTIGIDVQLARSGGRARIGMNGGTVDMIIIGKTAYVGGDKAFWVQTAGKSAAQQLVGKYVKTNVTGKLAKELSVFIDRTKLSEGMIPTAGLNQGKVATLNGKPVYRLSDGAGFTVDIALVGPPYPLEMSGDGAKLDLAFDIPVKLTPPPASKIIDGTKLNLG